MRHVAHFDIYYTQFLDHRGKLVRELPFAFRDPRSLVGLYEAMVETRAFDKKATALQRTGQLGTYASCLGQEAIGVAIASAMRREDVLLPSYRDYAAQFLRGVRMLDILLYWGGDERGMAYPEAPRHDFPICVPVGSQTCHAVGVAVAMQYRKEARVAVCILGDGATSKGDFYESMNLAGVWRLPVVFVINNNQWAISLPRSEQSAAETLAQKAVAAGIHGEQVDGNDVIALSDVIRTAIEKARDAGGASLIEALSYRLCDHTTADDARRYRSEQELKQQWLNDPIARLRTFLEHSGCWSETREAELQRHCGIVVEEAVAGYLNTPTQEPETMFDFLYATLPASFAGQRQELQDHGKDHAR